MTMSFRWNVKRAGVALAIGGLSAALNGVQAQETVVLRGGPACSTCSLRVTELVAIGDREGEGTIDHENTVAIRDSRGRFVVRGHYATALKVFSPTGRFSRSVGRVGGGPGEFRGIGSVALLSADTLAVFDWGSRKFSLFSPQYEVVTEGILPLTPELSGIALRSGEFVFNKAMFTAREIGQPLHRVGRNGALLNSFGSRTGVYRPDVPLLLSRAIAQSNGSFVWSAFRNKYQIDLVDARNGRIVKSIQRSIQWFPSNLRPQSYDDTSDMRPKPVITAIREDSSGRLWVLVSVADPNWERHVRPPQPGESHFRVLSSHGYKDSIVEVIDPARGIVLASERLPEHITHFVGEGLLGGVIEDADGHPRLQVWAVQLSVNP